MKMFDHHPDVMSLHEPEARLTDKPAPALDGPSYDSEVLRRFSDRIFESRDLRAVRKRPILRKNYRSEAKHLLRVGYIYGASAVERVAEGIGVHWQLGVPEMADRPPTHRIVKCVSSVYPLDALIHENPQTRFICIIRHPCGTVLSSQRGQKLKKYARAFLPERRLLSRYFDFENLGRDLTEEQFTPMEILAYRWAVYNGVAVEAACAYSNVIILRYEDLCQSPLEVAETLLAWTGLSYHENIKAFLLDSLNMDADAQGYHDLKRNPAIAAEKWRTQMDEADVQKIMKIACKSPAGALFLDAET
jgi:hypothetical protein